MTYARPSLAPSLTSCTRREYDTKADMFRYVSDICVILASDSCPPKKGVRRLNGKNSPSLCSQFYAPRCRSAITTHDALEASVAAAIVADHWCDGLCEVKMSSLVADIASKVNQFQTQLVSLEMKSIPPRCTLPSRSGTTSPPRCIPTIPTTGAITTTFFTMTMTRERVGRLSFR